MKPDTQARLFKEYAEFFPNRADRTISSMMWGFTCGEGWARLVEAPLWYAKREVTEWHHRYRLRDDLLAEGTYQPQGDHAWLEQYLQGRPRPPFHDFEVVQVKEKFGELRFYHQGTVTWGFVGVVDAVTWLAGVTCESCGRAAERQRHGNVVYTLCDDCKAQQEA